MLRRIFLTVLLLSSFAIGQAKRRFTFEDMMSLQRVNEPVLSPDGRWVVFSATEVNLEENTRKPHLWIIPLQGGEARRLLSTPASEDRPRWSPDGRRLLFVSSRDGGSQIWAADFDPAAGTLAGEARKITNISTEAEGELWSPDGENIVFTSDVFPNCNDDGCNKARLEERSKSKVKATIFTHLFYRHWATYSVGKRSHLFVVPAEGGAARDLTPGDHDVPPFTLGGQDMYAFSPDGQEVAYTSNIDEVEAASTNNEIFIVPISGGAAKKISKSPGSDSTPLYSPDGKYIAWRMQERAGYESDRFRLVIYDRKAGTITNFSENFDRWVGAMVWAPDSSRLYLTAEDQGEAPIYVAEVKGGPVRELTRGHNDDLAITPDGKTLVFTRMSIQAPNEIYKFALPGEGARSGQQTKTEGTALSHMNDSVLSQVQRSPLESFWFTGANKTKVEGFIVKPPDFDAGKKYPVKFLIHGGPQGAWGDSWTYRWNAQLFASGGYVVVMINPRGSTGYGQRFIDEINADWGGRAYIDLMNGLDYVQRSYPFADTQRACAMGGSFGGYMANWVLGHNTRFKCIVSHDGVFNLESMYGSTEELWFPEWEFRGPPWKDRALYRRWSPHMYAAEFKTPTLVVHGQLDYRLDVSEGFQLFTTLQRMKVASKMLYFPDEGHWVLKPQNSRLWYKTVNEWVDTYAKNLESRATSSKGLGR